MQSFLDSAARAEYNAAVSKQGSRAEEAKAPR